MTDKLTGSEIVKALRSWLEEIRKSRQAYLEKVNEEHYPSMRYEYLLSDTIHAINRLQAENERLSQFGGILLRNGSELFKEIQTAKVEARKEFTERLKKEAFKINYCGSSYNVVDTDDIDNLLKELVGENNASTT